MSVTQYWKKDIILVLSVYRSGLEALPNNAKMHYNWANWLKDTGNKTAASQHYHEAIR